MTNSLKVLSVRVLHLSDTHTHEDRVILGDHDLLLHTGDFCKINFRLLDKDKSLEHQNSFEQAMRFLDWLEAVPSRFKIITSGNHETFLESPELRAKFENSCESRGIIFKDEINRVVDVCGLKIAGAGAYPRIAPYMPLKHAYYNDEHYFDQIPEGHVDILLTHGAPYVSDNQFECEELDYYLRERIKDCMAIPYVFCGHVHESKGEYLIEGTTRVDNSATELKPKIIEIHKEKS